jgi:hypothetical protein
MSAALVNATNGVFTEQFASRHLRIGLSLRNNGAHFIHELGGRFYHPVSAPRLNIHEPSRIAGKIHSVCLLLVDIVWHDTVNEHERLIL